jgi:hypothetical protein
MSDMGVRINGSRERNKRGFFVLGKNNLLGLFITCISIQPSLMEGHENLGSNFILKATDKAFTE